MEQTPVTEPRGPMSEQMMIDEIKGMLGANTLVDAMRTLREIKETLERMKPIVSVDAEGKLHVAPLTVRQVTQVIAAMEGLTVK